MKKAIVFSHESDIDGLGSVVLAKLAFENITYELLPNVQKLNETFMLYIKENRFKNYDYIFITDLALYNPSLDLVNEDLYLRKKVFVFDHHKKALEDNCDKLEFTKIIEKDEKGNLRSGTDLFYEFLWQNNFITRSKAVDTFVELTTLEDTWQWKNLEDYGQKAHSLAIYLNAVGKEKYIEVMTNKLFQNSKNFSLNFEENKLVAQKKEEYESKLISLLKNIEYFYDEFNNKYGILFANYEYRNELSEYIRFLGNPQNIKYLVIVALDKGENGQKSYRSIEPNFDVNKLASLHGGGGHIESAAVNITYQQKKYAIKLNKKAALKYLADCSYNEKML